jgi:hypothetical protein
VPVGSLYMYTTGKDPQQEVSGPAAALIDGVARASGRPNTPVPRAACCIAAFSTRVWSAMGTRLRGEGRGAVYSAFPVV